VYTPESLVAHAELGATRDAVRRALEALSRDPAAASKALKLGSKNQHEREYNLELDSSPAVAAIERYTGVLYDALEVESLPAAARRWVDSQVSIQSALFGMVRASDRIPIYRLSAGSSLPALGAPLKRVWSDAHAALRWPAGELLLDLRSKDYRALAPLPAGAGYALNVQERTADGEVRALNHFNKAAKGNLVRRLALSKAELTDGRSFVTWAADQELECALDEDRDELTLVTDRLAG